jgi:hypothetical protein
MFVSRRTCPWAVRRLLVQAYHRARLNLNTADQYRQRAAERLRLAQTMADLQDKALLLEMAQVWFRLAEQVAAAKDKETVSA